MALTLGTGPFGQHPGGTFNDAVSVDGRVIWWEDSPRRVRASSAVRSWWTARGPSSCMSPG